MFAPLVIRYVDLMEASIAQGIRGVPIGDGGGNNGSFVVSNGTEYAGGGGGLASALGSVGSSIASAAGVSGVGGGFGSINFGAGVAIPVSAEELIWKLEALQTFIRELHWTDVLFAEHLDNRLKMMAADMIDAAANRYEQLSNLVLYIDLLIVSHLPTELPDSFIKSGVYIWNSQHDDQDDSLQ